jgi:hypothetical protein
MSAGFEERNLFRIRGMPDQPVNCDDGHRCLICPKLVGEFADSRRFPLAIYLSKHRKSVQALDAEYGFKDGKLSR